MCLSIDDVVMMWAAIIIQRWLEDFWYFLRVFPAPWKIIRLKIIIVLRSRNSFLNCHEGTTLDSNNDRLIISQEITFYSLWSRDHD